MKVSQNDSSPNGVALVIVLAVVVLLTGLVVAFFSRAISERQISSSSATQTRVDLFAQGAVSGIISNLQQEIALSSTPTTLVTGSNSTTLYFPLTPAAMMPQLSGTLAPGVLNWAPNFLIRSASNQNFYAGTGGTIAGNAVAVSSTAPSLNSRVVSLQRWNTHYLLPLASGTNAPTPDSTTFAPPDWVLVARDGSNPSQASTTSPLDLTWSQSNSSTVIGRYAFVIYHEGGLLDVNAAGYPIGSGSSAVIPGAAYKPALAFADLTQVGFSQAQADELVAWRNFGSIQPPGMSYLTPGFTTASGSNYLNLVLSSTSGFLNISGTSLFQNQSDRMFPSRMELINFVQTGLSISGTSLDVLNYLTTFSRGINQPSFNPDLYGARPSVRPQNAGGNDAYGKDAIINPSFLSVRVSAPFARNDGSQANIGDPLVSNRFLLQRLAWITYQGPSANRTMTDPDMAALIIDGISPAFLQLGTMQNIQNYFGLKWNGTNTWTYSGKGAGGGIAKLSEVASQNREPDFVELLQAAIHVGAIAKAATSGTGAWPGQFAGQPYPDSQQYNSDTASMDAIIQIAANIIEQVKTDGYPVAISFAGVTFHGSENLPYLSGVQPGVLKLREANPASVNGDHSAHANTPPLQDSGVALWMEIPEVWNPYDANCSRGAGSLFPTQFRIFASQSANYPVQPPPDQTAPTLSTIDTYANDYTLSRSDSTLNYVPPTFTTGVNGAGTQLPQAEQSAHWPSRAASNSMLGFSIPATSGTLFHDPTMLVMNGIPAGSGLAFGDNVSVTPSSILNSNATLALLTQIKDSTGRLSWNGSGFLNESTASNPLGQSGNLGSTAFVGILGGVLPVRYVAPSGGPSAGQIVNSDGPALWNTLPASAPDFTDLVTLQYLDPSGNWISYDTKLAPINLDWLTIPLGNAAGLVQQGACNAYTFDPRTSRFGMPSTNTNAGATASGPPSTQQWVDPANAVMTSCRPDQKSGYGADIQGGQQQNTNTWGLTGNLSPLGWHLAGYFPPGAGGNNWLKPGLFVQNSPAVMDDGLRYAGDNGTSTASTDGQFYADADGVVRRAVAAYVTGSNASADSLAGQALARSDLSAGQIHSRPWILHRPFQSVAELGYVFSGTPWKNLDVSTPESGYAALLDIFTVEITSGTIGMIAGRVNLNTQQPLVLQAILSGAYKDEQNAGSSPLTVEAAAAARALVARTSAVSVSGSGPLCNISELVGRWNSAVTFTRSSDPSPFTYTDGSKSYTGFDADLSNVMTSGTDQNIPRFREAAILALASSGETRTWNLLIDVIAQTGRYPKGSSSNSMAGFVVEGEQHRWVHVAIDRLTGEVIDSNVEIVQQ